MFKFSAKSLVVVLSTLALSSVAMAEPTKVPESIMTPDVVETRIGTLQFKDGYPTGDTATTIRDELDYLHGVEAFMNSIHGV